ncbi:MAG: response regulator [Chloroflexi bacterium]|jgi:DNA-binding NtrC family response regulator|nr:response regulator [Chloroflexota bacterium]
MNKDILIVDDEEGVLTLLGHVFIDLGWEVYTAKNAEDALTLFRKVQPPLVLTDLRLGGTTGVAICEEVKNLAPLTIVVAMSGFYEEDYSINYLRRQGFDHLLEKPVRHETCKKLVNAVTTCRLSWEKLM